MTNKEAVEILKEEWRINAEIFGKQFDEALNLAIKALHTVDIINEELSPADEDKAIWFDIPYWEEIQERANMRKAVRNDL